MRIPQTKTSCFSAGDALGLHSDFSRSFKHHQGVVERDRTP